MSNEMKQPIQLENASPYLVRPSGVAWMADIECSSNVLANWLVLLPKRGQHDLLFLTVRHLRGKKNVLKNKKLSHAMNLYSVDQKQTVFINVLPTMIMPPIYTGQWFCYKDEIASELIKETVDDMCMGRIDPFDEEKDDWIMRFGNNIERTEDDIKTSFVLLKEEIN